MAHAVIAYFMPAVDVIKIFPQIEMLKNYHTVSHTGVASI